MALSPYLRWPRLLWVVLWAGLVVWEGPSPTIAQRGPAFLNERCQGYREVEGTCLWSSCPTLQYDFSSLPLPEFVARHGSPCAPDLSGNELFCCPLDTSYLAGKNCGRSSLRDNLRSGVADPGAWPWLVRFYSVYETRLESTGCLGILLSDTHVLTYSDCAPSSGQEIMAMLGEYQRDNHTGVQNVTTQIAVRANHWSGHNQNMDVLILETPAVLQPNVVWPVCLSLDPEADLGFRLSGLNPGEKHLAYFPYWPSTNYAAREAPRPFLHQTQVFFYNCSTFCGQENSCPGYNVTRGDRNPVCVRGLNEQECNNLSRDHGTPIVVQSDVTGEFYLLGMAISSFCDTNFHLNFNIMPITPIVRDVKRIIQ